MEIAKTTLLNVLIGLIFLCCCLYIAGFGAAIAIPADFLINLIAILSSTGAFALVNFVTLGIPFVAAYLVIVGVFRMLAIKISYLLIAVPFILFNAYHYFNMTPHDEMLFSILTRLPRVC